MRKLPAGVIEGRESERGERRSRAQRGTDSVPVHFELILYALGAPWAILGASGASHGYLLSTFGASRSPSGP